MALSLNDINKKKKGPSKNKVEKKVTISSTKLAKNSELAQKIIPPIKNVKPWATHQNEKLTIPRSTVESSAKNPQSKTKSEEPKQQLNSYLISLQKLSQRLPATNPLGKWVRSIQFHPQIKIPLPELFIHDEEKK